VIPYSILPHLNAILNSASALLLLAGFIRIRRKDRKAHRRFMLSALIPSSLFLISYVIYHAHAGSVHFQGQGVIRTAYFAILLSHTVLAVGMLPFIFIALRLALRQEFDRHRVYAPVAFAAWLYVSVTGVLVYLMLYHYPV
jgi:putative membrane protein